MNVKSEFLYGALVGWIAALVLDDIRPILWWISILASMALALCAGMTNETIIYPLIVRKRDN